MGKEFEWHFSKNIQMTKNTKRYSTSLVIWEMHKRTTIRSTLEGWHEKTGNNKCLQGCGEIGSWLDHKIV